MKARFHYDCAALRVASDSDMYSDVALHIYISFTTVHYCSQRAAQRSCSGNGSTEYARNLFLYRCDSSAAL